VKVASDIIISSASFGGAPINGGVDVQGATGSILNNRVITHPAGIGVSAGVGIAVPSNSTVIGNSVENFSIGIWPLGDSNTITSNQVILAGSAIVISASDNVVENNLLFTNTQGGAGVSFDCTATSNTVIKNIINDSFSGIVDAPATNMITPNSFSNVTNVISGTC
jgi:hypothetical protein